jgi:hypothetical protein
MARRTLFHLAVGSIGVAEASHRANGSFDCLAWQKRERAVLRSARDGKVNKQGNATVKMLRRCARLTVSIRPDMKGHAPKLAELAESLED